MTTLKKTTSWALTLALILSICTSLGGGLVQVAQAYVESILLTFDLQDGSDPLFMTFFPGAETLEPPTPTRAGYEFLGWFTAASDGDKFTFPSVFEGDTTLYAQWEALQTFTLTYYANAGPYGTGTPPTGGTYYEGEFTEVSGAGDLAHPDAAFVFAGWDTRSEEDGDRYQSGQSIVITADTGLYAVWILNFYAVPLTGVAISDAGFELAAGETKALTVEFTPSNATDKAVTWASSDEDVATVSGGIVTAVGEGTATITVTSGEGGFTDEVEVTVFVPVNQITYIDTRTLPAGYSRSLNGVVYPGDATKQEIAWSLVSTTAPGAAVEVDPDTDAVSVTATGEGTVVVRATIDDGLGAGKPYIQEFTIEVDPPPTVTFDLNYGSPSETFEMPVLWNQALGEERFPVDPVRTGYEFLGWEIDESDLLFEQDTLVRRDITVYAQWELIIYNIAYSLGGGGTLVPGANPDTYTIETGEFSLSNPTRRGYDFAGWTGTELAGLTVSVIVPSGEIGDRTYLAHWTAKAYTLTLDYGYDDITEEISVLAYGAEVTLPVLTRPGYTFGGWVYGPSPYPVSSHEVTEDTTLFASWAEKPLEGITLNKSATKIPVGQSELLTVIFDPEDAVDRRINWESDNMSVAIVDDTGSVIALTPGTATIKAMLDSSRNETFVECLVTVVSPSELVYPTGVVITQTNFELEIGETKTLTAAVTPDESTYQAVTWRSSDTSIATVDEYGVVTAVGAGTATITSTFLVAAFSEFTDSIEVAVTAPFVPVSVLSGVNVNNLTAGNSRDLSSEGLTLHPASATNQAVEWEIVQGETTAADAEVTPAGVVTASGAGTVTVRAVIANGKAEAEDYTQDFTIQVVDALVIPIVINFHGNFDQHQTGGTGTLSETAIDALYGDPVGTLPTATRNETATHTYTFFGWTASASGGDLVTADSVFYSRIQTLYAQWQASPKPVTGTDDPPTGGGTPAGPGSEPPQTIYVFEAGTVTLSEEALALLAELGLDGDVRVLLERVPMSELQGMQAAQVKGYETVVSIDVFVGETKVDVPLTVSLLYTLKANENPAAVRVWYMDDSGSLTDLNGTFDSTTGMITFTITHQSYFVVGYDEVSLWENVFGDVSVEDWFYSAVAYVSHYGYVSGDGAGNFFPNVTLTRAQLATLLWNLEGQPEPEGDARLTALPFLDVMPGLWYYNAVIWAADNDVVRGDGEGNFLPEKTITRQEMIQMLYNYAVNFKEHEIPQNREMPEYTDADQIVTWAETAAKALAEAGVLTGLPEGEDELKPDADANRAEAALLLKNFIRFVIEE